MNNKNMKMHYGLRKMPFSADVDVKDYYQLNNMLNVQSGISFTLESSMNYALIGEIGAGKSSLLDYVIDSINRQEQYRLIKVVGGKWGMTEFLRTVLSEFNSSTTTNRPSRMLRELGTAIDGIKEDGLKPVLCVDEAHLLDSSIFQQLHLLSQQGKKGMMPIVLVGQYDLVDKLKQPLARPFLSRIGDSFTVQALSQNEALGYIDHHLNEIAQISLSTIEEQAKIAITQLGLNVMRNINRIALKSLHIAMLNDRTQVCVSDVKEAHTQPI